MSSLLSLSMQIRSASATDRSVDVIASSDALDSHGTIVEQSWKLDRYLQNPVVLWAHNAGGPELPVGYASDVRVEGGALRAKVTFVDGTANPRADQVLAGVRQKSVRGLSVGFRSGTQRIEKRDGRDILVLSDNELFEISFVPVPSNSEALTELRTRAVANATSIIHDTKGSPMKLTKEDIELARLFGQTEGEALKNKIEFEGARETKRELRALTPPQLRAVDVLKVTVDEALRSF